MSILDRFNTKYIVSEDGCWNWTGTVAGKGNHKYGVIRLDGGRSAKKMNAHRVSYMLFKGDLDDSLVINHLCGNTKCVNPDHLEQVTQKVNTEKGNTGKHQRDKINCINGHPYSDDNTYINPKGGRICRVCLREAQKRHYYKNVRP